MLLVLLTLSFFPFFLYFMHLSLLFIIFFSGKSIRPLYKHPYWREMTTIQQELVELVLPLHYEDSRELKEMLRVEENCLEVKIFFSTVTVPSCKICVNNTNWRISATFAIPTLPIMRIYHHHHHHHHHRHHHQN